MQYFCPGHILAKFCSLQSGEFDHIKKSFVDVCLVMGGGGSFALGTD